MIFRDFCPFFLSGKLFKKLVHAIYDVPAIAGVTAAVALVPSPTVADISANVHTPAAVGVRNVPVVSCIADQPAGVRITGILAVACVLGAVCIPTDAGAVGFAWGPAIAYILDTLEYCYCHCDVGCAHKVNK